MRLDFMTDLQQCFDVPCALPHSCGRPTVAPKGRRRMDERFESNEGRDAKSFHSALV